MRGRAFLQAGALLLVLTSCGGGPRGPASPSPPSATLSPDARVWVESTLAGLSDEALVGQLVIDWIPGGYAAVSSEDFEELARLVVEDHIGGLLPSIGNPLSYAAKLNALQARAEIPLLVASDFENGGPGMRINGSYALPSMLPQGGGTEFPPTMAFGAIGDERFAFEYGRITAIEARASGVHVLLAPVLDVNSNPDNPVIATRSFGADPYRVGELGAAFVRGARAGGAFTTGKHFPGHGDTGTDSHVGLPVVTADRARLERVEFVPFKRAIAEGIDAIMTAHVQVPGVLGPGAPPATLSPEFLTGILRNELGFDGLLFTDALTMRAVTDMYGAGEVAVRALEAGADVILDPVDVDEAIQAVLTALHQGRLSRERLERSARRILEMKARLGLYRERERFVSLERVDEVVGSGPHLAFADSAATRSITLVRDDDRLVPLSETAVGRTAHVVYAPSRMLWASRAFSPALVDGLPDVLELRLDERSDSSAYQTAADSLASAARVVVSAYVSPSAGSGPESLPEPFRALITASARARPTILISFGNPYLLNALPEVGSYIVAWGDREVSQRAAVAALFGEEAITGRLPIPLPPYYTIGHGLRRPKVASRSEVGPDNPLVAAGILAPGEGTAVPGDHQSVADPSSVGMSAAGLARVDSIIVRAVRDSASSAVAVAIGRHGRLVSLGAFGELAYGSGRPTTPTSIFDLASVSKVVGTTTAAMILVQEGRLDLDASVVAYLPWWSRGDPRKARVTVRQLLLHRAGLAAFHQWFFDLSGVQAYKDAVADEPLEHDPGDTTVYSDIGAMTLGWVVEEITGRPLDEFLEDRVFGPLGMRETMYRPPSDLLPRIAATELDTVWRKELVWGRVHDENADAMGGVSGHAGLFSDAVDLSVFARMMLNGGTAPACVPTTDVGEPCPVARGRPVPLLDPHVIEEFTTRYDDTSSRALGWDTPSGASSAGDYFTSRAFGHTGFTGTSIWIDPDLDLWVVLLTNRVHPTRENEKHLALRRAVHDAAAQAITDRPIERRPS